jgi:hypothetical protein
VLVATHSDNARKIDCRFTKHPLSSAEPNWLGCQRTPFIERQKYIINCNATGCAKITAPIGTIYLRIVSQSAFAQYPACLGEAV